MIEIKELIKQIYGIFFFYLFRIIPLKNKVVFSSFSGKRYGDNPKIISDKLYNEKKKLKQIWLFHDNKFKNIPSDIIQVKWGSISSIYHLATAKIWVDSHTKPIWVRKRKKQFFIETWHGRIRNEKN